MKKLTIACVMALLFAAPMVMAQGSGPFSAQIQRLLHGVNTWTGFPQTWQFTSDQEVSFWGGPHGIAPITVDAGFSTGYQIFVHSDTNFRAPLDTLSRSRGTLASPTPPQAGDTLGYLQYDGYNDTNAAYVGGASIVSKATGTFTGTNIGPADLELNANNGTSGVIPFIIGTITSTTSSGNVNIPGGAATLQFAGNTVLSGVAPTVASGFGTGPSIGTGSTAASFFVTVGTSPGTTGGLTLPTAAHGWTCWATDQTDTTKSVRQSANTITSATFTFSATPTAADVVIGSCTAH